MNRKLFLTGTILVCGLLVASAVLIFPDFHKNTVSGASLQWAEETGYGISVPACSSASAVTTCVSTDAQATIDWTFDNLGDGAHGVCDHVIAILSPGGFSSGSKGCIDSHTFTGLTYATTYDYTVTFYDVASAVIDTSEAAGSVETPSQFTTLSCFDYSLSASNITVAQGSSGTSIVNRNLFTAGTQPISISVTSGLPAGASVSSITNNPCSPTCSSNINISTTAATVPDTYTITVTATGGAIPDKSTTFTMTVTAALFDYSLSDPADITVTQGSSGSNSITATWISGSGSVTYSPPSGLPLGATPTWVGGDSCVPTCTKTLNISTTPTTAEGTYPITITANPGSKTKIFNLIINDLTNPTVDLSGPASALWNTAANLTWVTTNANSCTASASPADPSWSGSKPVTDPGTNPDTNNLTSFPATYTLICTALDGDSATGSVIINQSTPSLSIDLTSSPSPATGDFPLAVDLTAAITAYNGDPALPVNYTFWWDCSNPSNDVAFLRQVSVCGEPTDPAIGAKLDGRDAGQPLPSESVSHTYTSDGSYTAKVVVERSSATPQTDTVAVNVTIPPLAGLSCDVSPRSARTGDNVTWSAIWSGGEPDYTVEWTGSPPLPRTITSSINSSAVTIQYAEPGDYNGSVKVTSLDENGFPETQGPVTCTNIVKVKPKIEIR